MRHTSHALGWLESKQWKIASIGKNTEKVAASYIVDGIVKWFGHFGKQFGK